MSGWASRMVLATTAVLIQATRFSRSLAITVATDSKRITDFLQVANDKNQLVPKRRLTFREHAVPDDVGGVRDFRELPQQVVHQTVESDPKIEQLRVDAAQVDQRGGLGGRSLL